MDTCKKSSNSFVLFDNVLFHVLILFSIVAALFFLFIRKLTTNDFDTQFVGIVNTVLNPSQLQLIMAQRNNPTVVKGMLYSYLNLSSSSQNDVLVASLTEYISKNDLSHFFQSLSNNYNTTQDHLRQSINNKIQQETLMIIIAFVVLVFVVNFLFKKSGYCGVLKHLGIELLIVFACVGAIEFWFFENVGFKYIPVYPSTVTTAFQQKMNAII